MTKQNTKKRVLISTKTNQYYTWGWPQGWPGDGWHEGWPGGSPGAQNKIE